ncbi:MAG: DEAD/DEAH box helicase family protein [Leptospirales bacterium]|nr:DEAD/DEAH box helicase family protein [Leptospirales bacterium]
MEQDLLPFQRAAFAPPASAVRRPADLELGELCGAQSAEDLDFAFGVLDAHRIKLSHLYDKLSSLSNSRTRLLPHQIEATHIVANALRPRYLLADEVGLGKTVEAGLILKELLFRKGYSRVLVAAPAPLTIQWQQELKNKFNEDYEILERRNFYEFAAAWSRHPRILTSIDFIKNPRYADELLKARWDVVVFDEAHRLRRDYSKVTHAYAFAERIAERCEALLLLSATPFRGKLEELYYLVRLLDPHLLGPHQSFLQEYVLGMDDAPDSRRLAELRSKVARVMLRRRKVEVGGFTKRHARTVRFELGPEERAFYDETTDYVRREYNLAMREKNRAVSFIMIVFQKLLDSSTRALLRALEKRKANLEQSLTGLRAALGAEFNLEDRLEELEDSDDPETELDSLERSPQRTFKEMRKEAMTLGFLIRMGRSIRGDRKFTKMVETMERMRREGHSKFVIFTQFRTTQDYLEEGLSAAGFRVVSFHGSLSLQAKEEAIQQFRAQGDVLICTEAGGEGRNLQFASILINYDLPWSPLKIEQRIGRIHRFGQTRDVYIVNFATRDTVAERVLEVLEKKIKLFEETIGPPDILLGVLEDEFDFQNSLMGFITGQKSRAELEQELEAKLRIADSGYRKLNDLVTPHCLDFNLSDYYDHTRSRRRLDNDEIERLCQRYSALSTNARFQLRKAPPALLSAGAQATPAFASAPAADYLLYDEQRRSERPATFRSELALEQESVEFLAVGHAFVDEALRYFLEHSGRKTIRRLRGVGKRGLYFVFLCHYQNGMSRVELQGALASGPNYERVGALDEPLFPPGVRGSAYQSLPLPANDELLAMLKAPAAAALQVILKDAEGRAEKLKDALHPVFKREEYKLEISYGKKIRQLEERLDRARLKLRQNQAVAQRSQVTRLENELLRARQERERRVLRVRRDSRVDAELELLQVYVLE